MSRSTNHHDWLLVLTVLFTAAVVLVGGIVSNEAITAVSGETSETDTAAGQETAGPAATIQEKTIMLPGDVPLELVWIPPGTFLMGRYPGEQDSFDWQDPQHEVTIAYGFWMGKYPITQAQWEAVMGNNPSLFQGANRPVEWVSWNDIREEGGFLDRVNAAHPGHGVFRLPSEAEWEYAYRAGTTTRFYWGDDPDYTEIDDYAWYTSNSDTGSGGQTHDVGQKLPNAWGLHDMAGNVWEWCEDDWHSSYEGAPADGSAWVDSPRGSRRGNRGGSWNTHALRCRAATRAKGGPDGRVRDAGFRVVLASDED